MNAIYSSMNTAWCLGQTQHVKEQTHCGRKSAHALENTAAFQECNLTIPLGLDQVLAALPKETAVSTLPCRVVLCLQHRIIGPHVIAVSLSKYHMYEKDVHLILATSLVECHKYEKDVHLIVGEDISVANDGDSELVGSLLHQAPVSCSLVPLLHGAAMNGHCCCSCILQRCRHLQHAKCADGPLLCLQNRPFNRPVHMSDSCSLLCNEAGGWAKGHTQHCMSQNSMQQFFTHTQTRQEYSKSLVRCKQFGFHCLGVHGMHGPVS